MTFHYQQRIPALGASVDTASIIGCHNFDESCHPIMHAI